MSTTESPRTYSDLYTDLINRVRADSADTDGTTSVSDLAKRYINVGLLDMHLGAHEKVPWAERSATLVLHPKYETGTVTVTKGGTTVTGASTLWNTNNDFGQKNARAGGKIKFSGSNDTYKVTAVASDTSLTISPIFISDNLAAASYTYFEDDYALHADFLRPVDVETFDDNGEIRIISRTDFRKRYPRNNTLGKPEIVTFYDDDFASNTTRVRKARFFQPPSEAQIIPYSFITSKLAISSAGVAQEMMSATTDVPIVPLQYRYIIVLKALYIWYRDRKDDQRSIEVQQEYTDTLLRMFSDQEIGSPRARVQPRVSPYVRAAKHPYRLGSRYSVNDRFDRLEDR